METEINQITYRTEVKESDIQDMDAILRSSGFFFDFEIETSKEFLKYRLEDGEEESGSFYIAAESDGKMIGFINFGFDTCTVYTYILYWMAVHNDFRGKGVGKQLLKKFEEAVKAKGGKKIIGETSGRELYKPTRDFYVKNGYALAAEIPDYYAKGDSRVTIVKDLD